MASRAYVEGIHSADWEASDRPGHEPYLVVVKDDGTCACSCLDYFRHAHLYGEPNHACKHILRRAGKIVAADPASEPARASAQPERKRISFS